MPSKGVRKVSCMKLFSWENGPVCGKGRPIRQRVIIGMGRKERLNREERRQLARVGVIIGEGAESGES